MDLLDLFGRGYVIEHCKSVFKLYNKEYLYKVYVTDMLRGLHMNRSLIDRYHDLVSSMDKPNKKELDPDEIKSKIKKGINAMRGK